MTFKVKVNDPSFQYQPRVSQDAYLVILAQIRDELSRGQAKFPRILSQMDKMTLTVKVNDPFFQYQRRISHDVYLKKKCLRTDGQGAGRTDRRGQRQYPFGLKGQRVKTNISTPHPPPPPPPIPPLRSYSE